MEHLQFDHLARACGAAHTRRAVAALLGALVAGAHSGHVPVGARRKKKKKVTLCLNGETKVVPKKRQDDFLDQGATPGACPPGGNPCPAGTKRCNGQCVAAGACCTAADCDPCLREICVDGACTCPSGMARDGDGVCSIFRSCVGVGQTTSITAFCCSGRGASIGSGQFFCIPGNATCASDSDCLHGHSCVGNLCAPAYVAAVGDQCAERAFKICSERSQCRTGRCEENLCKSCATNTDCRTVPDPLGTCFCEDTVCLRRTTTLVSSCSQCPANTEFCKQATTTQVACYPACGSR